MPGPGPSAEFRGPNCKNIFEPNFQHLHIICKILLKIQNIHGLHPPPTQRTYGEHGPATHASRPWRRYPPSLPSTHPRAPAYTHARNAPLREANPSRRLRLTFRALEATRRFHARAAPGPAHRAAFAIGPPPPRPPIFAPVQGRRCQARRPDRVIGSARPTPARTSLPVRPAPARKSQN